MVQLSRVRWINECWVGMFCFLKQCWHFEYQEADVGRIHVQGLWQEVPGDVVGMKDQVLEGYKTGGVVYDSPGVYIQ